MTRATYANYMTQRSMRGSDFRQIREERAELARKYAALREKIERGHTGNFTRIHPSRRFDISEYQTVAKEVYDVMTLSRPKIRRKPPMTMKQVT